MNAVFVITNDKSSPFITLYFDGKSFNFEYELPTLFKRVTELAKLGDNVDNFTNSILSINDIGLEMSEWLRVSGKSKEEVSFEEYVAKIDNILSEICKNCQSKMFYYQLQ